MIIKVDFLPKLDNEDENVPIVHIYPDYPQCIPDKIILDNKADENQSDYLVQFLS